ncbi:class I SAM-dependent methyltransferase [Haloechinothrix sp. YIM 98757]|uniref:Class I SAM-dependent methyltransferase n=1 Tax=Haloechinothrix aidingensis TaxID=2752311 RepID=A0A838AB29_9PSEU|nr:class I SAM-dependent methyltransferase [Haloechinothrix aidingensis]MBA0126426.1 class I SAM-dependent methyltransferase [Haloechinothrix aidingensis]
MSRWADQVGEGHGARYASRFADLAESGVDVHGEARFCASLVPEGSRVLDAGCGTGRVAAWLAEHGYDCVGVDLDASMLAEAERSTPTVPWVRGDLATLDLAEHGIEAGFDLVVAAGNVIPLVAQGSEHVVVRRLAGHLRSGGLLVAGFGLDAAHLPLAEPTVTLADYDTWCRDAGLELRDRYATWDGDPYDGGGYAVSVHLSG